MDYKEIKQIMKDMEDSKLSSLEIEFPDGVKISMSKSVVNELSVVTAQKAYPTTIEIPEAPMIQENENKALLNSQEQNTSIVKGSENLKIITSPMVGTFYASSAPGKDPFVKNGDKIKKGQVVCIVEAMKLMNEIESEYDGEIVEVCVQDGEIVEYGMPLFKLK